MTRAILDNPLPDPDSRLPDLREALMSDEGLKHLARLVTIGELALCFSHEVRNHLTSVIGYAHMGEQAVPADDPTRSYLEAITRNSLRMKGMIATMLNFGRKREKTEERCAPEELINEALCVVGPYFANLKDPPIVVRIDVECGCPSVAVARWEMVHVLVNLLTNAADAMFQTRQRQVTISAHRGPRKMVRMAVADTGPGIAPEHSEHVFNPFFTTKGECGNGLGLYIVRNTIEDHGGSITLKTGSCGTVFTVSLPSD